MLRESSQSRGSGAIVHEQEGCVVGHLTGPARLRVVHLGSADSAVVFERGRLRVGSGQECDVVLAGSGINAHHVDIIRDDRGLVLEVTPSAERVHVNARPVREKALLRCGDLISVGTHKLLLRQDHDRVALPSKASSIENSASDAGGVFESAASHAALRAVAGAFSGKRIVIQHELRLDHTVLAGCVGSLQLRQVHQGVDFEYNGKMDAAAPEVNGVSAPSGCMRAGDQLAWCGHRFVVEVPTQAATAKPEVGFVPHEAALPEDTAGPQNEVWWLIATAALLALGMAVLLLWNR